MKFKKKNNSVGFDVKEYFHSSISIGLPDVYRLPDNNNMIYLVYRSPSHTFLCASCCRGKLYIILLISYHLLRGFLACQINLPRLSYPADVWLFTVDRFVHALKLKGKYKRYLNNWNRQSRALRSIVTKKTARCATFVSSLWKYKVRFHAIGFKNQFFKKKKFYLNFKYGNI
jgi:hypothetical protein